MNFAHNFDWRYETNEIRVHELSWSIANHSLCLEEVVLPLDLGVFVVHGGLAVGERAHLLSQHVHLKWRTKNDSTGQQREEKTLVLQRNMRLSGAKHVSSIENHVTQINWPRLSNSAFLSRVWSFASPSQFTFTPVCVRLKWQNPVPAPEMKST